MSKKFKKFKRNHFYLFKFNDGSKYSAIGWKGNDGWLFVYDDADKEDLSTPMDLEKFLEWNHPDYNYLSYTKLNFTEKDLFDLDPQKVS